MFTNFPKVRPLLPREIQEIYAEHYRMNREGATWASSWAQLMESWMHRQVAQDVMEASASEKRTLELGAGTLNQLPYESFVQTYDIVEPFTQLYENSLHFPRVRRVFSDVSEVPEDFCYDRITSIATLEHICNLPEVVARSALLLAKGGVFRASIPSEGTPLWTVGWKMTTGREFSRKYGLDYGLLMRHEHVNTAKEIEEVLRFFFPIVKMKLFGISRSLSLYRYYECYLPQREKCYNYLVSCVL